MYPNSHSHSLSLFHWQYDEGNRVVKGHSNTLDYDIADNNSLLISLSIRVNFCFPIKVLTFISEMDHKYTFSLLLIF